MMRCHVLNPKPGVFVVAFIPQFISVARGPVYLEMVVYGVVFAVVTTIVFSLSGCFTAHLSTWLSTWLSSRPNVVAAANLRGRLHVHSRWFFNA